MTTRLMGILNVTPDSFFSTSRYPLTDQAIERGFKMAQDGADFIDIGGESTRPGSDAVDEAEELRRVIPVVRALSKQVQIPLSIDTMKPEVAKQALDAGATFINDVSGFKDSKMIELAAQTQVPICVMHMQGLPKTMQHCPSYPNGIIQDLTCWFEEKIHTLLAAGILEKQIILDPGIGFGKTIDDNLEIIHNLRKLKSIGFPLLLGISRKSFMGKIIQRPTDELLATTIAINTIAILSEIDIIRVHDILEHRHVIDLFSKTNFVQRAKSL